MVSLHVAMMRLMKRRLSKIGKCAVLAGSFILSILPVSAAPVAPFPDMQTSWFGYQNDVTYLKNKGAIGGYPDGLFHPKDTINRAEFLKLIFSSKDNAEPANAECFADVPVDAWYAPFVCAAKRRGIISGYRVGTRYIFKPDQPIVFAEAIKMASLAYGNDVEEGPPKEWYKPFVDSLDEKKILAKWSYVPWAPITRERAADLIAHFVQHDTERAIPNLSPGCGKSSRTTTTTLTINGQQRSFLFTQANYADDNTPSPLIVAFHGRTNSNAQVRSYFGLDRAASKYFIAYPAAISNGNGSFSWQDPGDKTSALRDYAFFDAIVQEIGDSHCIDMNRIFVVGHSLGAYFANSVACARGGVVRGSATVGGTTLMSNCTGPSAAMILNNPKDTLSPHIDSEHMRDIRVAQNTCLPSSHKSEPSAFSCVQYDGCTENPVLFCPHTIDTQNGSYYPHVWPKGTAEAMVQFFDGL